MADYVVRFTGQDNLSPVIKKVKQELNGTVQSSDKLDQIALKFKKIDDSAAPLKRKLADLQNLMTQMNLDGLSNTDIFSEIAQKAGTIKDAMLDARQATNNFASDTFKLDAVVQGMQGIAAATSVATGVMGLFGSENKEVARAILKVQSVLAILNGVQTISNTLNKDSAFIQRLKQIKIAATTAATTKATVAEVANTGATIANTAAQKAWNVAKATGKALLGDWSGLVLVATTALAAYSLTAGDSSDSQEDLNNSVKEGSEIQQTYTRTLQDTYANLMTSYTKLRSEWNKLSTEQQKVQWIKNNKAEFEKLEVSINDTASAERVFNGNTDAVVNAFVRRAKAAARLAQLTELYRKQVELIDKRNQVASEIQLDAARSGRSAKAGDEITDSTYRSSRYGTVDNNGRWVFSEQGARLYSGTDTSSNSVIKSLDNQMDKLNGQIGNVISAIQSEASVPVIGVGGGRSSSTSGKRGTTSSSIQYAKDSLGWIDEQIKQKKLQLSLQTDPKEINRINKEIEELENQKVNLQFQARWVDIENIFKDIIPEGGIPIEIKPVVPDSASIKKAIKDIQDDNLERDNARQEKRRKIFDLQADSLNNVGDALSSLGSAFEMPELDVAGMLAQAIVTMIQGYATATSQAAALGPWAWIAFAALGAAQLAAIVAQVKNMGAFAEGGIIGGNSFHGDNLVANVNAGEMILSRRQQSNLFNLLDSGATGSAGGTVEFKISGSTLKGVLTNYNNKMNKVK